MRKPAVQRLAYSKASHGMAGGMRAGAVARAPTFAARLGRVNAQFCSSIRASRFQCSAGPLLAGRAGNKQGLGDWPDGGAVVRERRGFTPAPLSCLQRLSAVLGDDFSPSMLAITAPSWVGGRTGVARTPTSAASTLLSMLGAWLPPGSEPRVSVRVPTRQVGGPRHPNPKLVHEKRALLLQSLSTSAARPR